MKLRCIKCTYNGESACDLQRPYYMTAKAFQCTDYEKRFSLPDTKEPPLPKPKVRIHTSDEICFMIHGD